MIDETISHFRALEKLGTGGKGVVGKAIARADAIEGDPVKTRALYEQFFSLWKDADLDVLFYKKRRVNSRG
jgi:hypothetical protein